MNQNQLIPTPDIACLIHTIREQRVILDADLARLYGVETRALNQALKRNSDRFPEDFVFRLSADEVEILNRSQTVIGPQKHRDPRFPPFAFTEHGALMGRKHPEQPTRRRHERLYYSGVR